MKRSGVAFAVGAVLLACIAGATAQPASCRYQQLFALPGIPPGVHDPKYSLWEGGDGFLYGVTGKTGSSDHTALFRLGISGTGYQVRRSPKG